MLSITEFEIIEGAITLSPVLCKEEAFMKDLNEHKQIISCQYQEYNFGHFRSKLGIIRPLRSTYGGVLNCFVVKHHGRNRMEGVCVVPLHSP